MKEVIWKISGTSYDYVRVPIQHAFEVNEEQSG
jgi:hypothetical protein